MIKQKVTSAGDTIIEVLIAIAVMSFVLGSAFAISNRSQLSIQDAQEHTEALKIAQSQVEQLKQISDNNPGGFDNSGPPKTIFNTALSNFCIQGGKITAACQITGLGGFKYIARINVTAPAGADPKPYTFEVIVNWPRIHDTAGNLNLYYNLDPK
jgi:type II secretory pathway pseudopilin PulG